LRCRHFRRALLDEAITERALDRCSVRFDVDLRAFKSQLDEMVAKAAALTRQSVLRILRRTSGCCDASKQKQQLAH
jgi:hypothetical protein